MPDMDMLRRFAGADPASDESVLQLCLDSAKAWFEQAGVPEPEAAPEGEIQSGKTRSYDFWVCNLASWFYDNRGATGPEAALPPFIVASVHGMRPEVTL